MTIATLPQIGLDNGAQPAVLDGICRACAATGADFRYMLANASLESGLDNAAKASTSSAVGLYQFIEQTWLALFREHGAKYGQGDLATRVVERPGVAAAELLPRAAAANRSIFYAKDGRPCTVAEVFGAIERRFDNAATRVESLVDPVEYSAAATVSAAAEFVPPASASAWSYDLMLPLPILMALHEVPEDDRQAGARLSAAGP